MMRRAALAVLLVAALCSSGIAYDACIVPDASRLTPEDVSRLENLDTSRTRGLGAAMRADNAADRAVVAELFEPGLAPVEPDLLVGTYQCRTIKMGNMLPLVVYQWFRCEISATPAGFAIRKLTGSQNFSGTLMPAGSGYAYRGALSYGYEDDVTLYDTDAARDQVGCLSAVTKGNRHFVLELPFPKVESFHDVIELRPAGR